MSDYPKIIDKNFNEDPKILDDLENLISYRRGYVFEPPIEKPVVFIISGGLDSSLVLDMIIKRLKCKIFPIYVERGAKAEKYEKESVKFYVDYYQKIYPGFMQDIFFCQADIPPANIKRFIPGKRLETIGHPMRNAVLQSIGVQYGVGLSYAQDNNITTLFTATSPDDTFPHSSLAALRALNLLTCLDNGDWNWQVTSPLLEPNLWGNISKKEMIIYAKQNNLPLDKTRTCTTGKEIACGVCPECVCRLKAFKDAGIEDSIAYEKK
jgi:7-cyano-7-deazaguanine synthase